MMRRARGGYLWMVAGAPWALVALAWVVGRVVRDEWQWGQVLFWVPAPVACIAAVCAALCAWRAGRSRSSGGRAWGRVAATAMVVCVWAGAHTLWWSTGWGVGAVALHSATGGDDGRAVIVHWNPRAPGDDALECARALCALAADIYVISNPGAMLRGENAAAWVPPGWHVKDEGVVGVVSRWPIPDVVVRVQPVGPPSSALWVADAVVNDSLGMPLRVRVVDLPSSPRVPRGRAAATVRRALGAEPGVASADILVGDFNSTEGSVLFDACGVSASAPAPWRSIGWLGTFPRAFPLWRIDWFEAAPGIAIERYEAIDLGVGLHRAQRAVVRRRRARGVTSPAS